MSSSELPKLLTKTTKIGHIFWKQSTLKIKGFKKISLIKVGLLIKYSSKNFFFGKIRPILDTEKWLWNSEFWDLWQGCS